LSSEIIYIEHEPAKHIQIVSLNDQERAPPKHI
jgi:hypothetical protein